MKNMNFIYGKHIKLVEMLNTRLYAELKAKREENYAEVRRRVSYCLVLNLILNWNKAIHFLEKN